MNYLKTIVLQWIYTIYEHKDCLCFGVTLDCRDIANKFVPTYKIMSRDRLSRTLRNYRSTGSRNHGRPLERLLDV